MSIPLVADLEAVQGGSRRGAERAEKKLEKNRRSHRAASGHPERHGEASGHPHRHGEASGHHHRHREAPGHHQRHREAPGHPRRHREASGHHHRHCEAPGHHRRHREASGHLHRHCEASGHLHRHCEASGHLHRHCEASAGCRSNPVNTHEPNHNATRQNAPRSAYRANQQGLTLLEFTLIVIVISILAVIGLQRMVDLRVNIERAAVERTVQAMQTGLALKFAELAVRGELDRAHEWEGGNPFELLVGQDLLEPGDIESVREIEAAEIGPGTWSYDEASGEVVYRVRYADALAGAASEGRWRVVVIGAGDNENNNTTPGGLTLEPIRAIDWPA